MSADYRQNLSEASRLSRRRFAGGFAGAGIFAAAAGLVGCSSGNNNNGKNNGGAKPATSAPTVAQSVTGGTPAAGASRAATSAAAPGSATPAALDSTKGKPGGTLKYLPVFPGGLSVVSNNNAYYIAMPYSSLLAFRWNVQGVAYNDFSLETDLAAAMPEQTDPTTLTYKLRQGVKFHNGRVMTSEDVKYSYDRYSTLSTSPYAAAWKTWYDHVETPDPQTVVLKTKLPFADAAEATAGSIDGYILAKEFEEGPDVNNKQMGTGPYIFVDAQLPTSATYKKNPDYYLKPYPYFDQIQLFATTDPAARLTTFTTRQVHLPSVVYALERDEIKQARPDAKYEEVNPYSGNAIFMRNDKPPFNDKRVRQALSMTIDRKTIRDTTLKGEGRNDQLFSLMWQNQLGTHEVKDLGDSAKYWNFDPQSAKQLFAAAGLTKPIDTQMSHYDQSLVGQFYVDIATLVQAQWKQQGVANVQDNNLNPVQFRVVQSGGQYEGTGLGIQTGLGALQKGNKIHDYFFWGPNGEHSGANVSYINDPQLSQLAVKQIGQFNDAERKQTFQQMEAICAEQQYTIVLSTTSQTWFWDPSLQNVSISQEQTLRRNQMKWWFA